MHNYSFNKVILYVITRYIPYHANPYLNILILYILYFCLSFRRWRPTSSSTSSCLSWRLRATTASSAPSPAPSTWPRARGNTWTGAPSSGGPTSEENQLICLFYYVCIPKNECYVYNKLWTKGGDKQIRLS